LSIQIANNQGLVPRLRHIEQLEDYYVTVEDRVEYAMADLHLFSRRGAAGPTGGSTEATAQDL
jgi:hypothetical protein